MSEDPLALSTLSTAPLAEADYNMIFAAMMETERGRWFLTEYARRNRRADTELLLAAIARIEAALRGDHEAPPRDHLHFDLGDMAQTIARTLAEIAAIKPDAERNGKIVHELDEAAAMAPATEMALSATFAASERIRDVAWALRERVGEAEMCEALEAAAREIDTACKLHEVTGRRAHIAIALLHALKDRIEVLHDSAEAPPMAESGPPPQAATAAAEPAAAEIGATAGRAEPGAVGEAAAMLATRELPAAAEVKVEVEDNASAEPVAGGPEEPASPAIGHTAAFDSPKAVVDAGGTAEPSEPESKPLVSVVAEAMAEGAAEPRPGGGAEAQPRPPAEPTLVEPLSMQVSGAAAESAPNGEPPPTPSPILPEPAPRAVPRPPINDPLAAVEALSEEEKIALSS